MWLHTLVRPAAQASHGSTPRAAQVRIGSRTTRVPLVRVCPSSVVTSSISSATTSWPGTNGNDTTAEK